MHGAHCCTMWEHYGGMYGHAHSATTVLLIRAVMMVTTVVVISVLAVYDYNHPVVLEPASPCPQHPKHVH